MLFFTNAFFCTVPVYVSILPYMLLSVSQEPTVVGTEAQEEVAVLQLCCTRACRLRHIQKHTDTVAYVPAFENCQPCIKNTSGHKAFNLTFFILHLTGGIILLFEHL